jgi:hypothetical protein
MALYPPANVDVYINEVYVSIIQCVSFSILNYVLVFDHS